MADKHEALPKTWFWVRPDALLYDRWNSRTRNTALSGVGGCYALYRDGELAYIGSSVDLDVRLRDHIRSPLMAGETDRWTIKVRPSRFYGDWATRELRLIRRLLPSRNNMSKRRHERRRSA